jgi:hypothetical protein
MPPTHTTGAAAAAAAAAAAKPAMYLVVWCVLASGLYKTLLAEDILPAGLAQHGAGAIRLHFPGVLQATPAKATAEAP